MSKATLRKTIYVSGYKQATRQVERFRKELEQLNGASATVTINVVEKAPSSNKIIIDDGFVDDALVMGMQLDPPMLSPRINNGRKQSCNRVNQ